MNKTAIEWCDYTVNPVKGYCPMACEYCYARRLYDRFHWDKTIRMDWDNAWYKGVDIRTLKEPSRIFVGSTIELFGDWVGDDNKMEIIDMACNYPQHTFIFLTKQPENLAKWNWPDNAWVGVSTTSAEQGREIHAGTMQYVEAPVRFMSAEPLTGPFLKNPLPIWCNWLIIGAETGNRKGKPPLSDVHKWAGKIIEAADSAGVPVFLKDNLKYTIKRQEMPI